MFSYIQSFNSVRMSVFLQSYSDCRMLPHLWVVVMPVIQRLSCCFSFYLAQLANKSACLCQINRISGIQSQTENNFSSEVHILVINLI